VNLEERERERELGFDGRIWERERELGFDGRIWERERES
jgi:hypothetical protein